MKRILSIVTLVAMLAMAVGCNKEETPSLDFNYSCDLNPVFDAEGGELVYKFSAQYGWSIEIVDDWLSAEPMSGSPADGKFTLIAEGHESGEERTTNVKIRLSNGDNYVIPVKQKMFERFDVEEPKEYYIVEAEGGEVNIALATNLEYNVTVANNPKWIRLAQTRSMRNETISLEIDANSSSSSRIAIVEARNVRYEKPVIQSFTIIQSASTDEPINEIIYTSDNIIELSTTEGFGCGLARHIHDSRYGRIIFESAVTEIPEMCFANQTDITSIWLPANITRIGHNSFFGCTLLESIKLPEALMELGTRAFSGCEALTEVSLPANIESFGSAIFEGCTCDLIAYCNTPKQEMTIVDPETNKNITVGRPATDEGHWLYGSTIGNITLDGQVGAHSFLEYSAVESITLESNVRNIHDDAFKGCGLLSNVKVGSLKQWCGMIFGSGEANPIANDDARLIIDNQMIKSLQIPSDITTIREYAFYHYALLESINIPDHVASIGQQCFDGCDVGSIYLGSGIKTVGRKVFNGCKTTNLTINVNIPKSDKDINSSGHWLCGIEATNITYGDKVTHINNFALGSLTSVEKVTVGDNVTYIGEGAFSGCTSLENIALGASVTTLDKHAFYGCTALEEITLPESLGTINAYAFDQASALVTITIPANVTYIGEYTFRNCNALESIYCAPTTPPTLGNQYVFGANHSLYTIYVPAVAYDAYCNQEHWSQYKDAIVTY